jgi:hypothetical protein
MINNHNKYNLMKLSSKGMLTNNSRQISVLNTKTKYLIYQRNHN